VAVLACAGLFASAFGSSFAAGAGDARRPGEVFRDCTECVGLVVVPSGDFDMGSHTKPAEQPIHHVRIPKSFAIGVRPVTFAEWDKCVAAGGCSFSPPDQGWGRGDRPVTNVSWDDAKEFLAWISKTTGKSYRLPTEAEWEYAARAGSKTAYWWGEHVGAGNAQCADCGAIGSGKTSPSGSFRANAFGLYDTAGNVAEWIEDCWSPTYRSAPNDGSAWTNGDCTLRVLRGGSFADKAVAVRSSARFRYDHDVRYYANGFRVARDVVAPDQSASPVAPATGPAPSPKAPAPFENAVLRAANDLLAKVDLEGQPAKVPLVFDPVIDGATGGRTNATVSEEKRIVRLVEESFPRFEVQRLTAQSIAKSPLLLIGTLTALNSDSVTTSGPRDTYRVCLRLINLATRKVISKAVGWATPQSVDPTPTPFFADSPAYVKDLSTEGYIESCHSTKVGDQINPAYADQIVAATLVNQAIEAYEGKRYGDALELYRIALRIPGGEQLRVLNGLYLANLALHRRKDADEAFGKLVDLGFKGDQLAVKFLFEPGSTIFLADPKLRERYDSWLATIAQRTASTKSCLEVVGHTSATGIPALNELLSVLRAQYVKDRLEAEDGSLRERMIATGKGSRELIVGTGRDDASDALDRRVEFDVVKCGS
jgi:formylglycine-generating enzyme required for sulfatase activity/outer membrane protein OmpA-like peptidoglycan-associated protein